MQLAMRFQIKYAKEAIHNVQSIPSVSMPLKGFTLLFTQYPELAPPQMPFQQQRHHNTQLSEDQ
jgi:hypothetical protein